MGRAFYLLSTIPSKGERKSLDLYSHSAKAKMGSVMVDLRIRGLREGLSSAESLAEHLRLTRAVVDSESKVVSGQCNQWLLCVACVLPCKKSKILEFEICVCAEGSLHQEVERTADTQCPLTAGAAR